MVARIFVLLVALSLIPITVFAEFYKYKDANGVLRFTDNLLDVPKDQREKIQTYKEVVTPEPEPDISDAQKEEAALKNHNSRAEQINNEREALEQSFMALDAERKSLLESPPGPQEQEAYEAHKKRIEAFNAKIKAYEEQRKMFQAKVNSYNAEIENP